MTMMGPQMSARGTDVVRALALRSQPAARRRRSCGLFLVAAVFATCLAPASYCARADSAEVLRSDDASHVFIVRSGQGSRTIDGLKVSAGQKIRLVGFGPLSLDQVRTQLRTDGADVVVGLGAGQELRVTGVSPDIMPCIQIELDRSGLVPTFHDDFEALSLDREDGARPAGRWRTNYGYGAPSSLHSRTLVNNGELEIYADPLFAGTGDKSLGLDPFSVVDGRLDIIAQPLPDEMRKLVWGRRYSSGLLTTRQSFSQRYGVFEIRMKTPAGKGLWPAFWMLPASGEWPPEIDVVEILGGAPTKLYVSWHSNVGGTHTSETRPADVPDTSAAYHTYSLEWTKETLNWYFDDIQIASKETPADFHQTMYLLVNLAVGGNWPGSPDASTHFPAHYSIDWIRAFARIEPDENPGKPRP